MAATSAGFFAGELARCKVGDGDGHWEGVAGGAGQVPGSPIRRLAAREEGQVVGVVGQHGGGRGECQDHVGVGMGEIKPMRRFMMKLSVLRQDDGHQD